MQHVAPVCCHHRMMRMTALERSAKLPAHTFTHVWRKDLHMRACRLHMAFNLS